MAESDLPECARLSGGRRADGESASEVEDQQIAEAMARSQSEMKKEEPKNITEEELMEETYIWVKSRYLNATFWGQNFFF